MVCLNVLQPTSRSFPDKKTLIATLLVSCFLYSNHTYSYLYLFIACLFPSHVAKQPDFVHGDFSPGIPAALLLTTRR